MKTVVWASIFLALAQAVFGEPAPPTADQVREWANFSRPVQLTMEKVERRDQLKPGEVVWCYTYRSRKETLYGFSIGLYKAGTLFGDKRSKMETHIEEASAKLQELLKASPGADTKRAMLFGVETRSDGRKVYFAIMGMGPGGSSTGGFTTLGEYDLIVEQIVDGQDVPQEQRLKNPAEPQTALPDLFQRLEQYISTGR